MLCKELVIGVMEELRSQQGMVRKLREQQRQEAIASLELQDKGGGVPGPQGLGSINSLPASQGPLRKTPMRLTKIPLLV